MKQKRNMENKLWYTYTTLQVKGTNIWCMQKHG